MDTSGLATHQKKARRRNASLIFIDETGILLTPLIQKTWSRRGQTPVLTHTARRHRKVSAIGALTISPSRRRVAAYVSLHAERSIREHEVLDFLKRLTRHIRGNIILLWDRLQAHRSKLIKGYINNHKRLDAEFIPTYAPEVNPIEQLWNHTKRCKLANYCPHNVEELEAKATATFAEYKDDQPLLQSFLRHAGLPIRLPLPSRN